MFDALLTPTAPPTPSSYKLHGLTIEGPKWVTIRLQPDVGEMLSFKFVDDQATAFINLMNTGDHSTVSLGRKILQYLNDNGYLEGTVS